MSDDRVICRRCARDFKPVKEKTPTQEDSMTMLQQLMGNVGRFNGKEGVPKN
jgi:hypothetical protein